MLSSCVVQMLLSPAVAVWQTGCLPGNLQYCTPQPLGKGLKSIGPVFPLPMSTCQILQLVPSIVYSGLHTYSAEKHLTAPFLSHGSQVPHVTQSATSSKCLATSFKSWLNQHSKLAGWLCRLLPAAANCCWLSFSPGFQLPLSPHGTCLVLSRLRAVCQPFCFQQCLRAFLMRYTFWPQVSGFLLQPIPVSC